MKITKENIPPNTTQTQKILNRVIDFYHKTFIEEHRIVNHLINEFKITDKTLFSRYKIGYANGSLLKTVPERGPIFESLKQAGILNSHGKECYMDCLIIPEIDEQGNCLKITAKKLLEIDKNDLASLLANLEIKTYDSRDNREELETLPDGLFIKYGQRKYYVRGIDNSSNSKLRVNIKAVGNGRNPSTALRTAGACPEGTRRGRFHIDTLDLYASKQRKTFAKETELLFKQEPQVIEGDLNKIIERVEEYIQKSKNNTAKPILIPDKEKAQAIKFLKSPDLIQTILKDFETIGCAGEKDNKIMGYLAAVSRKLDDPLSLLILSRSAAGKSTLQDAILELVPEEDRAKYTRITGQALFYKGENSLRHKLIAIEEEEGSNEASYSIRTMQSSKSLTIATTVKDTLTGQMKTQEYHVRGPLSVILTTTRTDIDYETTNRFIVLTIDETRAQTKLIHKIQRGRDTVEGLIKNTDRDYVTKKHHNAQRLLRPLKVVNPFADYLTFADDRLRARRDHKKYLNLIKAITFLHQYQREIKNLEYKDQTIEYIEVTLNDIGFANILASEIFGRSLDELTPPARKLLSLITELVTRIAEKQGELPLDVRFTRKTLREYSKWSDWQIRLHLKELTDMEYVAVATGKNGLRYQYQLIYDGKGEDGSKFVIGLTDIMSLKKKLTDNRHPSYAKPACRQDRASAGKLVSKRGRLELTLRPACGNLVRAGK